MSARCTVPVGVKPAPQSSSTELSATLKIPVNVAPGRFFRIDKNVFMKKLRIRV
jgi:hypothetical protein